LAWLDFEKFGVGFEKPNRIGLTVDVAALQTRRMSRAKTGDMGWRSLDSIPKSTLEARPRGVPPGVSRKPSSRPAKKPVPPSQVEYRQ